MTDLPRRAVVRGAKLAALPLGVAGRAALGLGKRVGGRSAELVNAELQARTAEQVFSVLGQLKGGAMKVGQAMSIFEAALPEEMAEPYRAALTRLQDSAPGMPSRTVHQVLRDQLGHNWRRKLIELDEEAVAAASIGQVHRAVWKDGTQVAVKIQYPGVAQALLSDLNQLALLARTVGTISPGMEMKPLTDELRERMVEELDYRLEGASQQAFAQTYADHPLFDVPSVLAATEQVLVTTWQDGRPLSDVIARGDQDERDAAAQRYLEFLLGGPEACGLLHADPHPGNFRMTPEGRLGVIDFGAVNHLPDGLPDEIGTLVTAAVNGDAGTLLDGLRRTGFIRPGIRLDAQVLLDFLDPFLEPARHETFRFDRPWLRGMFAMMADPRRTAIGLRINLPPEYMLIHRVWGGGIGVLSQLGGTIRGREAINRYLPGADLR